MHCGAINFIYFQWFPFGQTMKNHSEHVNTYVGISLFTSYIFFYYKLNIKFKFSKSVYEHFLCDFFYFSGNFLYFFKSIKTSFWDRVRYLCRPSTSYFQWRALRATFSRFTDGPKACIEEHNERSGGLLPWRDRRASYVSRVQDSGAKRTSESNRKQ